MNGNSRASIAYGLQQEAGARFPAGRWPRRTWKVGTMPETRATKQEHDGVASFQPRPDVLHQAFADKATLAEEQRVSLQELLQH